jgi:hypothetical protein
MNGQCPLNCAVNRHAVRCLSLRGAGWTNAVVLDLNQVHGNQIFFKSFRPAGTPEVLDLQNRSAEMDLFNYSFHPPSTF